jgi:hypothetical protein
MYLRQWEGKKMITVEPIMDFGLDVFVDLILSCHPDQVNIGADSGKNGLPEPPVEKVRQLIGILSKETRVYLKSNLARLLKE